MIGVVVVGLYSNVYDLTILTDFSHGGVRLGLSLLVR